MPAILVLALGLFCAHGQEKKAAQPASVSPIQSTNSSSKLPRQNGLNDLEKSIFGSFRNFGEDGDADSFANRPLPRPIAPNRETREKQERRKEWGFMTPEELVLGRSTLETYKLDGTDKDDQTKLLSPMERWLLNKEKPLGTEQKKGIGPESRFNGKNSLSPVDGPDERDKDRDESLDGVPESVREAQRALRLNQEKEKKETAPERRGFSFFMDVFALERRPSLEEQKEERERLDAYRKSLGLDPSPTFESPFAKEMKRAKDPYRITPAAMMGLPDTTSPVATNAATVAVFKSSPYLDPAPKLTGSSSLAPALPKLDPPKTVLPPTPTFAAPRRAF